MLLVSLGFFASATFCNFLLGTPSLFFFLYHPFLTKNPKANCALHQGKTFIKVNIFQTRLWQTN
jgi:hypothetical protein